MSIALWWIPNTKGKEKFSADKEEHKKAEGILQKNYIKLLLDLRVGLFALVEYIKSEIPWLLRLT